MCITTLTPDHQFLASRLARCWARRAAGLLTSDDTLSLALEGVWRAAEKFVPGQVPFRVFASICTRNLMLGAMRGALRRRRTSFLKPPAPPAPTMPESDRRHIRAAVDRLPEPEKHAVKLVFWEGKSFRQASRRLGRFAFHPFRRAMNRLRWELQTMA